MNHRFLIASCACGLTLLLGLCATVAAQEEDSTEKLAARVDGFFRNLSSPQVDAKQAFDELLVDGPLEGREEVAKMIERVKRLDETYGKFLESEQIDAKPIGKDLVLLKYLYKAEKYPVVWYFTYYRPPMLNGQPSDWVVISLRFDTRLDLLGL